MIFPGSWGSGRILTHAQAAEGAFPEKTALTFFWRADAPVRRVRTSVRERRRIPSAGVLALLSETAGLEHQEEIERMPGQEVRRISHQLARYCQYHFQHYADFKSLEFLDSLCTIATGNAARTPAAGATKRTAS